MKSNFPKKQKEPHPDFICRLPRGPNKIWAREYEVEKRSLKEIGNRYGVTFEGVRVNLLKQGVKMRPHGCPRMEIPKSVMQEWKRLARKKHSIAEIHEIAGAGYKRAMIRSSLKRHNVKVMSNKEVTKGALTYELRLQGLPWWRIAQIAGHSSASKACLSAKNHAIGRKRMPKKQWPVPTPRMRRTRKEMSCSTVSPA